MAEPNYMHSVGVPYSKLKKEIPAGACPHEGEDGDDYQENLMRGSTRVYRISLNKRPIIAIKLLKKITPMTTL